MKKIAYLKKLLGFAYKHNPILTLFPVISLASVMAELLAMMSLLPLSMVATGQALSPRDPIVFLLNKLELSPTPKCLMMAFCILFIFRMVTNVVSQNISLKYSKRVLAQLASSAFNNIIKHCQLDEIGKKSIGHYISLAGDESFRASTLIFEVHQLGGVLLLGSLYYFLIFWYSKILALSVLTFLLVSFLLMGAAFRKTHQLGELQVEQSKSATSIFLDSLNGLRTIRSFVAENFVTQDYQGKMNRYTHTLYKIDFINILIKFIPITFLFAVLIIFMQSRLFERYVTGDVSFAFVITMILFLMRFFPVVGQGLNILLKFIADAKAARDVTEMIATYPSTSHRSGGKTLEDNIHTLAVEKLKYAYPGSSPLFDNVNIQFKAGKSYALTGPSGTGKSTLFNILALLSEVQTGRLLINNTNYLEFEPFSVRTKILLVEQESIIFNDTILNNITLGKSYSLEEVREACQIACIEELINDLPGTFNFKLQYQGQNLSGGQRQRIGIARAVLRKPDVLLLDEVTSALDETTKKQVVKNIQAHFKDKIIIFITHDQIVAQSVDERIELHHAAKKYDVIQNAMQVG